MLAGVHQPDEGTIEWEGEQVTLSHPQAAMDLGVATMYQELDLVEGLTVAENIFLGHEQTRFGFSQRSAARREAAPLLAAARPPRDLALASRSARSRPRRSRSSAWPAPSRTTRGSSSWTSRRPCSTPARCSGSSASSASSPPQGVAVVYISHRLEEIREIGDRVTVLKDGRTVATGLAGQDDADAGAHPAA